MSSDTTRFSPRELYNVAIYQRVICVCILVYLIGIIAGFFLPETARLFLGLAIGAVGIVAAVFVFMLAVKVWGTGVGIVLGLLTLIPCINLIALLIINQKATWLLKRHGYKVGLLGARLSQFNER